MESPDSKELYPCEPEWKIILRHLIYQDHFKLYRICRKMIIYLDHNKVPEIQELISELQMEKYLQEDIQSYSPNRPRPKGMPFFADGIINRVFEIAEKHLSHGTIAFLLNKWARQESLAFLSGILEKRQATLSEVSDALHKFIRQSNNLHCLSVDERMGLRVSLIIRFLSDNLSYINIAKKFIRIETFAGLIQKIVGPPNGCGRLGGKSAGMILACQILKHYQANNDALLAKCETPKSWFLTSDTALEFINYNALDEFMYIKYQNPEEIKQEYPFLEYIFKISFFPPELMYIFSTVLDDLEGKPIIVRSSSLLEDSYEAAFSGKYKSLFLSNVGTKKERLAAFLNAIAEVYASTFGPDPIVYRKERGLLDFREEMSILIQEVIGTKIGKYFFPSFAGVAFSNNEFRWSPRLKREDGIVRLVAGLGTRAVDRTMDDFPTLISPGQPNLRINQTADDTIKYSQRYVDVINLEKKSFETITVNELIKECHGNFPMIEKIVSFIRDDTLVEPMSAFENFEKEQLAITFNSLIKNTNIIKQIKEMMTILKQELGVPVDIEFACDGSKLYLLQCRPQSRAKKTGSISIPTDISKKDIVFTSNKFVNNGLIEDINFLVYVDCDEYSRLADEALMQKTGRIIGELNMRLDKNKFILIGPGRWGSKGDIKLGVPVNYSDINNSAMLVEVGKEKNGYIPELSFGTHFFQDLVESDIKYMPLYPDDSENYFNEEIFSTCKNHLNDIISDGEELEKVIKVIRINEESEESTVSIIMDGDHCKSIAYVKRN